MTWLSAFFGICELISNTERRACAFCDYEVTFSEPTHVLLIDFGVSFGVLDDIEIRPSDMLGKDDVSLLDMLDNLLIQSGINAATSN